MRAFDIQDKYEGVPLKKLESGGRSFLGFQIYYDESVVAKLDPNLNPYYNDEATIFLESQVIADLISSGVHRKADFFGVFSWKMKEKLNIDTAGVFSHLIRDGFRSDIYTFPFDFWGPNVWYADDPTTLRLAVAGQKLLNLLGFDIHLTAFRSPAIFQNHFICRSEIYEAFYYEMLKPCLDLMKESTDPELQTLLQLDSRYPVEERLKSRVRSIYGNPYYTLHPFIAERLFSTWVGLKSPDRKHRTYIIPSRITPVGEVFGGVPVSGSQFRSTD